MILIIMKLEQTIIEKTFIVKHDGKIYTINYYDSDGFALELLNKFNWEVCEENGEKMRNFVPQNMIEEEKEKTRKEVKLSNSLIDFCIENFDRYKPEV